MWTASVEYFNKGPGQLVLGMLFSDGASQSIRKEYVRSDMDLESLKAEIAAQLASYQAHDALTIPLGVFDTTPAVVVITPDPNAAIKASFSTEWIQLKQMQVAVGHGLKTAADLDYIALVTKVKSDFLANQAILLPLMVEGT